VLCPVFQCCVMRFKNFHHAFTVDCIFVCIVIMILMIIISFVCYVNFQFRAQLLFHCYFP
jgi:hypothetical protein